MNELLAVAAGGAIGAVARFLTVTQVGRLLGLGFPFGTLAVNVLGSFILGLCVEYLTNRFGVSSGPRAFFVVGVLGAYTTFSSFSLDVISLFERQAYGPMALYVMANVVLSIGALFLGLILARAVFQ